MEDVVSVGREPDPYFWRGRRVLLTGHSGFKGAWAAFWLHELGAEVHGLALASEGEPNLWDEIGAGLLGNESFTDLREVGAVRAAVAEARPQIVVHMAAQALVRRGYSDPVETFAVNTLGTAHLLDALRGLAGLEAVLIVTSDKVYANDGGTRPFVETDRLGGNDPYSASKAASELIARSFGNSWFERGGVPLATARAGNVIGGGDWSEDRLVPDVWRACRSGTALRLRSPQATRPWQHVLEPLCGYFCYLEALATRANVPRALNFGPQHQQPLTVQALAETIAAGLGGGREWAQDPGQHPPEAESLSLDSSLAEISLGWSARLATSEAADWTARWYRAFDEGLPARNLCLSQIRDYRTRIHA